MKIRILAILMLFAVIILPLKANFSVTDVEYLKGDDFIQLHFITNDIIPIPDLFYPNEDNSKLIVMRIADVDFNLAKNEFKFDSHVVDNIKIKKNKKFVDVKIKLKEKANYRVFTNQQGLFIEFPNVKRIVAKKNKESTPITGKKKMVKPVVNPTATAEKTIMKKALPPILGGKAVIRDFKLIEKNENRIKFEFYLSGLVDYDVIPIAEAPVRLAIDFKNTRANRIKREINCLNVSRVRGAYNTPDVYRIVFDLLYLKSYNIFFKDNRLIVEFFNKLPPSTKKEVIKAKVESSGKTFPGQNEKGEKAAVIRSSSKITLADKVKTEESNPGNKPVESETPTIEEVIEPKNKVETGTDFFEDEKSQVLITNATLKEDDFFDDQKNNMEIDSKDQLSYLRKTISTTRRRYSGEPVTFNFKNADLENILLFFAKISGLSIVIDPGVSGTITARLYDIPWDQALEYFLKVNGLDMQVDGNLLRIGTIAKLSNEAKALRQLRESREMEGKLDIKTRPLSFAAATQLAPLLKKQLTARGDIQIDARSNTLIISEVAENFPILDKLIETLDTANPQVAIEARIVEANSNYTKSLGIQWGYGFSADAMYGNQTSLKFPSSINVDGSALAPTQFPAGPLGGYAVNYPASGATTGTIFSLANVANTFRLDVALSAMENLGEGRIISAPKTTTQNNTESHIMQGKQIPIQTMQNNTISVTYVPAALELKVTPQITAKGTIICNISIKNNSADFANPVEGRPPIITQSIDTTVMVDDGGTIVIGGMYRVEESKSRAQTPFFSKIPIIGNLFKSTFRRSEQKELLIFITPRIIK